MVVITKGGSNANGKTSIFDVGQDLSKRKQCFSCNCHVSNSDFLKISFENPSKDNRSPATPPQAPLCLR